MHGVAQLVVNVRGGGGGVKARVLGQPVQPAVKGAVVAVHRYYARTGAAGVGGVDEAEAEVGFELGDQFAALEAEDARVDAAAVEAEKAGKVQGGVFVCFGHCKTRARVNQGEWV